jgi:hypothetical protein
MTSRSLARNKKQEWKELGLWDRERAEPSVLARENPVDGNGDPKPSPMRGSRDRCEAVAQNVLPSRAHLEKIWDTMCRGY